MDLDAWLANATIEIRVKGALAEIPNIEEVFQTTRAEWTRNPHGKTTELRARFASLIYGGHLGLRGEWALAAHVYGEPFADTPPTHADCTPYAALMLIGQAVALWHQGDGNAGWAALGADGLFTMFDSELYGRWRGIAALIMCVTEPHTVHKQSTSASALRQLDQTKQPQAYALARFVNGRPGCYSTLLEILTENLGSIPATEGLYLFNEI